MIKAKILDLIDNKDDYAHRLCDIYKASFTGYSDLYIVREQIWITPGRIARMENNYYNDVQLGRENYKNIMRAISLMEKGGNMEQNIVVLFLTIAF